MNTKRCYKERYPKKGEAAATYVADPSLRPKLKLEPPSATPSTGRCPVTPRRGDKSTRTPWLARLCAALFLFAVCAVLPLAALAALDGPSFSGLFDVKTGGGMTASGEALSGFDVYANLRLQERVKDSVTFYTAFNAQAASGMFAAPTGGTGSGEALFEVERLYLRWAEDSWGVDAGLMPLHFGYGQVFAPSDFLIKKNPAVLDARPRGIIGAAFSQYPLDTIKITEFAVFPPGALGGVSNGNPGGGWEDHHFGAAFENHFASASVQALYAFKTPSEGYAQGVHYFGASLKVEAGAGLLADTLYRCDPAAPSGREGLALSAGADCTLGKLYVLAEYLYNGERSASHLSAGGLFAARNLLSATFRYTVSDLTSVTAQCLWAIDDASLLPSLVFSHDLMQGFTLSITAQVPLDLAGSDTARRTGYGELGPDTLGQRFSLNAGVRLRI